MTSVDSKRLDPIAYRFCRVVSIVHPLLNATLQYRLDLFTQLDPEFVCIMKRSFYDVVTGEKTIQETSELYDKVKSRLAQSGFKLGKWLTNSEELRAKIIQPELCSESSVDTQVRGVNESYAKATIGVNTGSKSEKVLTVVELQTGLVCV